MAYCSGCASTDITSLEAHLAEVQELSAAHDKYLAEIEQSFEEGGASASDVQKAYKISDKYEDEIDLIRRKIEAMQRIAGRLEHLKLEGKPK